MNKLFVFLIFIATIMFSGCSVSSKLPYTFKFQEDSVIVKNVNKYKDYSKKYSEDDGVFIFHKYNIDHYGSYGLNNYSTWSFNTTRHLKYIVNNRKNDDLTTFSFELPDKANIKYFDAIITSPDGKIERFKRYDLHKEKATNSSSTFKLAYPNITEGSIVEEYFSYTLPGYYSDFNYDYDMQISLPCEEKSIQFSFPDWWTVQIKNTPQFKNINFEQSYLEDDGKTIFRFSDKMISAYKEEIYSPFKKQFANYVEFKLNELYMGVLYSSHSSWQSLMNGIAPSIIDNDSFWSSLVDNKAEEILTNVSPNTIDSVRALISYVQQDILSPSDNERRDFTDIIKDKLAKPHEQCGLAFALLNYTSVKPELVFIHSAMNGVFDRDYISLLQFSFPALKISIKDQIYFALPYVKNLPINLLPNFLNGEQILTVKKEGKRYISKITSLPMIDRIESSLQEKVKIDIAEDGFVNVTENKNFNGLAAFAIRNEFDDLDTDEFETYIKGIIGYRDGDVRLVDFSINNLENIYEPLSFEIEYVLDNVVTITHEELIFQTGGLLAPSSYFKIKKMGNKRTNPIHIKEDEISEKTIEINLPLNWELVTELENVNIENLFGNLKSKYKITNNTIQITQSKHLIKTYQPKERFTELLKLLGANSKLSTPNLVFEKVVEEQSKSVTESN